jgi:hypothetical protein
LTADTIAVMKTSQWLAEHHFLPVLVFKPESRCETEAEQYEKTKKTK